MIRVFVYTCDNYLWCLKPFAYLFGTYWSELQDVIVGGFTHPQFPLPGNFRFHQIDKRPYPKEKWSDGLIKFLGDFHDDVIVLMLEDYLLNRTVDCGGVATLADYMRQDKNGDVVRFDLTMDRLSEFAKNVRDVEGWGHYDVITCDSDSMYNMSLQVSIWNRRNLLSLLKPGMNPWEVETQTDMVNQPYRVLGSRQNPVRYANLMLKGSVMDYELDKIPEPHRSTIARWIVR